MSKRDRIVADENIQGAHFFVAKVTYLMGGHNWMSGNNFPRGYYLSVSVVERLTTETPGVRIERFMLGQGFKSLLAEAARFSQKRLDEIEVSPELLASMREKALRQTGLAQVAS
jgi:hypothetical protein